MIQIEHIVDKPGLYRVWELLFSGVSFLDLAYGGRFMLFRGL